MFSDDGTSKPSEGALLSVQASLYILLCCIDWINNLFLKMYILGEFPLGSRTVILISFNQISILI